MCLYLSQNNMWDQLEVKGEEFKGEFIKMVAHRKNEKNPRVSMTTKKSNKQDL